MGRNSGDIEIYKELGEYERHFNQIQSVYRGLASTWLLGCFGGISFLYSRDFNGKLPVSTEAACAWLAFGGAIGIALLWLLDGGIYHRLLLAVVQVSEELETTESDTFPPLRAAFARMTRKFTVRHAITLFYAVPASMLCVVALVFEFHDREAGWQRLPLVVGSAIVLLLAVIAAFRYVRPKSRQLIVVCGLPGTGKSTAAKIIGDMKRIAVLRSDEIRQELPGQGGYDDNQRDLAYEEMFERARETLKNRTSIVLDATFYKQQHLETARQLAKEYRAHLNVIELRCDAEPVIVERLKSRRHDPSEADVSVYQSAKASFEPIRAPHLIIDNMGTRDDLKKWIRMAISAPWS